MKSIKLKVWTQVRNQYWEQDANYAIGSYIYNEVWDKVYVQIRKRTRQVWDRVREQALDRVISQVSVQVWNLFRKHLR